MFTTLLTAPKTCLQWGQGDSLPQTPGRPHVLSGPPGNLGALSALLSPVYHLSQGRLPRSQLQALCTRHWLRWVWGRPETQGQGLTLRGGCPPPVRPAAEGWGTLVDEDTFLHLLHRLLLVKPRAGASRKKVGGGYGDRATGFSVCHFLSLGSPLHPNHSVRPSGWGSLGVPCGWGAGPSCGPSVTISRRAGLLRSCCSHGQLQSGGWRGVMGSG